MANLNPKKSNISEKENTSLSKRFLSNKDIQNAAQVTDRTVRRWAKHFGWKIQKLNSKVVRYDADDVEKTLGVEIV